MLQTAASEAQSLKVLPKEITVTVNDHEITYGDAASNAGVIYDTVA